MMHQKGATYMLIESGTLTRQSLAGQVAIVTGGGGGIGFEAARSLAWLGARVVIAEINKRLGKDAAARLSHELGMGAVTFVETDIGDERGVNRLASEALRSHGKVDIVLNNATIAPLGAAKDISIKDWDASYRVNLRGPVLLAQAFLPGMLARDYGVFACVSSFGIAYMGAYEIFKKAQVDLANTLETELEKTGVITFTIGPGVAPTQIFQSSVQRLAPMYGKTVDEFYAMVKDQFISVEAAGAGFAAAIALAKRFRGQEILSLQALQEAGIDVPCEASTATRAPLTSEELGQVLTWIQKVRSTLAEQAKGWKQRSVFEQQWCIRDFKKEAGLPIDKWLEVLDALEGYSEAKDLAGLAVVQAPLGKLASYYDHLNEMARGYVKDPVLREEQLRIVQGWHDEVEHLKTLLQL
jgi:NAD(P)-dependent dehydrogenase (short-subunit alcohol dehydrogenase family)